MKPFFLLTQKYLSTISYNLAFLLVLATSFQYLIETEALNSIYYQGNETDHFSLLAIKSQFKHHPNGVLSSWNDSLHHCDWEGVTCGRKHNRVVSLDLNSRGLLGTISPFVGNMSFIRVINLFNNSLQGQIPPEIGRLVRLQQLALNNNTLVGEVPHNLSHCSNLKFLYISVNKLDGKLPTQLGALSNLKFLVIHENNFIGNLFEVIANLTSLSIISAGANAFTGTIPNSIDRMKSLKLLSVGENDFTGIIPASVFNLSFLEELDIVENQFLGELPADIGSRLPHMKALNLGYNQLSGSIPMSILNLTSLELIGFEGNNFTGRVPRDFGHLQHLNRLDLFDNHIAGDIGYIGSLVNCSKLQFLQLAGNEFTGILPESIANLSASLAYLTIGDSPISGAIPTGIKNLINLVYLTVGTTFVGGSIPHELGMLRNLQWLQLGSNRLTGRIPNSLGNLSFASTISLRHNILQGSIPTALSNCQNLLYLDLANNQLNGTIPNDLIGGSSRLLELYVHDNHLEGMLQSKRGKEISLQVLDVSENSLSGTIPDGLGDCLNIQLLMMKGNSFNGSIPNSLSSLSNLQNIDLSSNKLSGSIPNYLSKFPLIYLNLSNNNFEGMVPRGGVFQNESAIFLNGNSKLCGGIPMLKLPMCLNSERNTRKKSRMSSFTLKLTVSILCALVVGLVIGTLILYLIRTRKKRRLVSSLSSMIGKTLMRVSYNELLKATDGFSLDNLLGAGGFGSVFQGTLNGKIVAVKVLNLQHYDASKSFVRECRALREVHHRNLVAIITVCSSIDLQGNDFRALVYEHMPKGSLDKWLHDDRKLSFLQRVDIAIDVANALNYLHNEGEIPIVHCDLKPSNILLDKDMVAHVGDFGLSKFLAQSQHSNQSSTIRTGGTVGYVAPEYGLGSEASQEGDLYSYGILLLELVTGRRPTDSMFKEDFNLHTYAKSLSLDQMSQIVSQIHEDNNIIEDADTNRPNRDMVLGKVLECMAAMVNIGVNCSNHFPQDRMNITDAIIKLQVAKKVLKNRCRDNTVRGATG